jgi:hypothetical protein
MFWFGTYRIYPVKDFMNVLILNFVCELFLQTLPLTLLTMQANTLAVDASDDGVLTTLQSSTLTFNIICLVEIVGQFILIMKENCQI